MQPSLPQSARGADCAAVILAAGRSTRMKSATPKPLHPLCGMPLTRHVAESCREAGIGRIIVVVGHEAEAVRAGLGDDLEYALQAEPRGSGDAARAAEPLLRKWSGDVLVLAGDVPLLRPETLRRLLEAHRSSGAQATLLTAILDDPTGYGRILRNPDGTVARIVEHEDATEAERAVKEWNPSIYCFQREALFRALGRIQPDNAQGELYLTDTIGILAAEGARIEALPTDDPREVLGVNNRAELAEAGRILRERILAALMLSGVTITDPAATYVDRGVEVGRDAVLEPGTFLLGRTRVGARSTIGPFTRVVDSVIGEECVVAASQVAGSQVGSACRIGPFANLRPGCVLGDGVRVGDFVEMKNARIGDRVSASHLSYIGDAEVGAGANIGAGTVTCNYDGFAKHRTRIGSGAFVGTHTTLVAPVEVGDGAITAAGSVITENVPADALAIARQRQTIKPGWARRWREARGNRARQPN